MDATDFDQFVFGQGPSARTVLTIGEGPAVVLCHELQGLSPACLDLAGRLARESFTVFAPVLFGTPGQTSSLRGLAQVCLSREFTLLRSGRSSPISNWLRALAPVAERRAGRPGVAAIGMCVTGGVVLPVLLSESVRAVVSSQPSLPFAPTRLPLKSRADLGVSPRELERVKSEGKPVLGIRFSEDSICPPQRIEALERALPNVEVCRLRSRSKGDHAALTFDFAQEAFDEVISFLRRNLAPRPPEAS